MAIEDVLQRKLTSLMVWLLGGGALALLTAGILVALEVITWG